MFPMFMPNSFPRPPADMSGLSVEELRAMEGIERENIEARIQWLRDIQSLLDGAMLLIQQYNTVAANSSISGISIPREPSAPSTTTQGSSQVPFSSPATGVGARPKYSKVEKDSTIEKKDNSFTDLTSLEGAAGYTPPKEEMIPEWEDPTKEEHKDEADEIRRRRLERFLSENNSQTDSDTKRTVPPHQD